MSADVGLSLAGTISDLEVPAFVTDSHGKIVTANEKASLVLAKAVGALVGSGLSDVIGFSAAADFSSWCDEVTSHRALQAKLELTVGLSTGTKIWSVVQLQDIDGKFTGFLFQQTLSTTSVPDRSLMGILNNTDAAADVDDLVRSELRWKTAVLSANQGVWDHDFELDRHFMSDNWRAMRGIAKGAAVAETTEDWLKTIHPDDVEGIKAQIAVQEFGQTDIVNYTFRQRHADGHWMWILSRGRVVRRTANGSPARIIGTDTDVSDLKAVERERARLAKRLGMAIEAAEMGQWELHIQTDHAIWDPRALEIFGLRDGLSARPETDWAKMIHPDDRVATVAYNNACVSGQRDIACDYRIVTPDRNEKYIRTRGKYVRDEENGDYYIGVNLDLTEDHQKTLELEKAHNQLEYESRHDVLTGLANRRRLDEVFTARAVSDVIGPVGAMHLDIDRFKEINDNFGHDAGDFALKHAASILRKYLPADALPARVGGDEFVAFFPQAPHDGEMERLAKQIMTAFDEPFLYGHIRIKAGISIGIAILDQELDGSLFICADTALYHAKKNGRGMYRVYEPSMRDQASRRIELQNELILAFERDEITCHYQPQFDAHTMFLSGIEALVRWQSPVLGLVMPDHFLSTVEEMGLIAKLEDIVFVRILADIEEWIALGFHVPHVSVNITAQRLADPDLEGWIEKLNIPAGKIVFELLETAFLDCADTVVAANLRLLKRIGIDVEIDDFGTGHASIVSLLHIGPKRFKIAQELVEPTVQSPTRRALLETIIGIGKLLEIKVIAEGVETPAHVDILRDLKCDFLQGFSLARPMSAAEITAFLKQQTLRSEPVDLGVMA